MRGVLLDFYGTLVFEDDEVIAAICDAVHTAIPESPERPTAREIGSRWWDHVREGYATARGDTFVRQRELARRSLYAVVQEARAAVDVDALLRMQFAYWSAPPMFAETPAFLQDVRRSGLPVCIVSNIDREDIEAAIALHGIAADHVLTSEDVRSYKPNPELFDAALEVMGLTSADVLHVGDSRSSDVAGATALGIPVAWVNRAKKRSAGTPLADYEVSDLMTLLPIIHRLTA